MKGFLEDYFCTSAAWSVRKSAHRVLMAVEFLAVFADSPESVPI